ncbi:DUF4214 domain-containing protein [Massilia yuzhufengensis]|uniref:Peptidase M10 serralysin C terminal n=1 Tax=Massilia yuzhufengensis TaxID=1164594 RepID=A0A1I1RH39_9BURK|nr:DUF4214 domain-containing protein [Massilia yuzhufengensis]SFD33619.1 Peptidase M10 serralysin C terminal [Massilia yuzhufengensis]
MANYENAIQQLYVAYYNRPGDPAGLAFWHGVVEAQGGDTSAVCAAFASSAEYIANYGGKDNRTVVNTVYRNLFGRDGEPAGLDYWAKALDARLITVDGVVTAIAGGARNDDLVAYANKVKFATSFTSALDLHPEKAAYNGSEALAYAKQLTSAVTTDASLATATAGLDASTAAFVAASKAPIVFTLSANADAGVAFKGGGGNDTFNATAATFSAGDSIHGGGGVNTLFVIDNGSALATTAPAGASVTNVQHITMSTKGGVGNAAAYDMSGFAGLQVVDISAAGAVNVKVADAVDLVVGTSAGAVTTSGGRSVSVTGNTGAANLSGNLLASVNLANTSQAATIDNATIDHLLSLGLTNVGNGATVTDATAKTINLQVNAAQGGAGSHINLAAAKATALNIDNATAFQLTTTALAADDKLATMTLRGAGSFSADVSGIASLNTFDASQSSGANTVSATSTAGLVLKGGSGVDKVSMAGFLAGNAVVELGAGNDRYEFTRTALSGARVDGGAGVDTIVANDAALFGVTSNVVYSNFETLDFSSGKGVYDLDRAGSVTTLHSHARLRDVVEFTNGRANSTIEFASLDTNLDLSGKATEQHTIGATVKFTLKDASGANDKLTISMTANDAQADGRTNGLVQGNIIETSGIETITLHSSANKLEPDNPATGTNEARTAADYVNGFSYLYAQGSKTILVTGDASMRLLTAISDTLTNFDASASTGNVNFDGVTRKAGVPDTALNYIGSQGMDYFQSTKSGVVFQGNDGKDTVLLYRYEQVKDIIKFTDASDSQLVWASQGKAQVNGWDTIYDFQVGVDKIDLSALHLAAGTNRDGFATIKLASNTDHILQSTLKDGVGVFNDNGTMRSIAFAMYGVDDGWMLVDVNGDGDYTSGTDMIFSMYGNTAIPVMSDFIF